MRITTINRQRDTALASCLLYVAVRAPSTTLHLITPMALNNLRALNLHRRRGCRGGSRKRRHITTILQRQGQPPKRQSSHSDRHPRRLVRTPREGTRAVAVDRVPTAPGLYILNINSLAKPHALDQLSVELMSYNINIAVITETHLKPRHSPSLIKIDGFNISRRDRLKRRNGGVAVFVRGDYPASEVPMEVDSRIHELLWVKVRMPRGFVLIGALYHPAQ